MRDGGNDPEELFRYLYDRYYVRVVAFLVHLGCTHDEARDLGQDVFLRVYESMDSYRRESEWKFLEITARRLALNRVRARSTLKRQGRAVAIDDVAESMMPASQPVDIVAQEEKKRLHGMLTSAIAELPIGIRECLALWLSEHTYGEIQQKLGISMNAVKSRLHDARARLRELLGKESDGIDWPEDPS